MSQALPYVVRVVFRFVGSEKDSSDVLRVTAKDAREAQSMARLLWLEQHPPGQGAQYLGSSAEPDVGQLELFLYGQAH